MDDAVGKFLCSTRVDDSDSLPARESILTLDRPMEDIMESLKNWGTVLQESVGKYCVTSVVFCREVLGKLTSSCQQGLGVLRSACKFGNVRSVEARKIRTADSAQMLFGTVER